MVLDMAVAAAVRLWPPLVGVAEPQALLSYLIHQHMHLLLMQVVEKYCLLMMLIPLRVIRIHLNQ